MRAAHYPLLVKQDWSNLRDLDEGGRGEGGPLALVRAHVPRDPPGQIINWSNKELVKSGPGNNELVKS